MSHTKINGEKKILLKHYHEILHHFIFTSLEEAEGQVLKFVKEWTPEGKCPLAGNSVGQDAKFLEKYMPLFYRHLHYRIVDVSTLKELCRRWYPEEYAMVPKKRMSHRALDDIKESIEELRYYRQKLFK